MTLTFTIFAIALLAGFLAYRFALPPLIGYLIAGFAIPFVPALQVINFDFFADIGVTLLLFMIGLKLDVRLLIKPYVVGVTSLHMLCVVAIVTLLLLGLQFAGWSFLDALSLHEFALIGFALAFSSTVFAVKVLEERGEIISLHGKVVIGILVMQDIFAVIYLGITGDKTPALYAPLVLLLIPLRPVMNQLLVRCGHGELLVLAGFVLAFVGYQLFEAVGLKGDIGALFMGALLAGYDKSHELSETLLNFKNLLLVAFFLSVGPVWSSFD